MANDPRFDIDLHKRDILDLTSSAAVAACFARLRYDTSTRIVQTAGALGLTEAVARPIRRIELIADRDLLQVYLVELSSVTIKATRDLVRSFRDRAGNFLFVLTSDYERIDFVLLDRLPADLQGASGIATATHPVRPRVLTVERRNPSTVALRVIRRFTWTENDGFAQFEKIRAAFAVADWSEEEGLFNNRALFSDHYLKSRLREDPSWSEEAAPIFRSFRDLFRRRKDADTTGEADLRPGLLDPSFKLLGFHAVAVRRDPNDVSKPDYQLYAARGDEKPVALALTYPWMRYLDGKDETRDSKTPAENPGAVVVSLLQELDVPWVIVTNGKLWRLYAKRTHSRATSYYEVDVEEALADASTRDPDAFRYFWLLFRRQAFELVTVNRAGGEEHVPFLDRLLLESEKYAKELGQRLKEHVFEQVFPYLAEGFISRWDGEVTDDDLSRTYRGTLTLLYRLLFLLYAESRDLLPVREVRGYFSKSLDRLKRDVAGKAGSIEDEIDATLKKTLDADSTALYDRLSELFAIIDKGSSNLNVPFYNGGLFSTAPGDDDDSDEAEAARFLRDHSVPDRQLAAAIDLLARDTDPRTHERVFVDYKSLGVRHLGSIYEGLLEFRLRFASERLGIVREKSRDVYKSWRELDDRKKARLERDGRFVKKGHLYLENDKHERKATGSYYTPDHIVKYIVEHAVGPVVTEKLEALRPKLRKAQQWRHEAPAASKAKGETVQRNYDWGPLVEDEWCGLIDDVFDIKVLDPAMGSGHFLVEAVDFITDRILDFLNKFPWNPVTAHLRWTRETILKEMERQAISIDPAKLTDINLLKRHVLKRCIYGVDLNPMAVELAKVSLWLDCFTLGAPLSFLDHHLRCGNSLVGVTVEEVEEKLKGGTQTHLFSGNKFEGLKQSVASMIHIGELSDITAAQVKESREEYRRASDVLKPAKRLLDVYTSQWFGNDVVRARGRADFNPALDFLGDKASEVWAYSPTKAKLGETFGRVAAVAESAATVNVFFHWQLEFPEVFYSTPRGVDSSRGFDAVVGNPPYLRIQTLRSDYDSSVPFFEYTFTSARGKYDVYALFVERGARFTSAHGIGGMIVPNKFLVTDYGAGLRDVLTTNAHVREIVNFRDVQVFADVSTYCCLLFWQRLPPEKMLFTETFTELGLDGAVRGDGNDYARSVVTPPGKGDPWAFSTNDVARRIIALNREYATLETISERIFQGIITGADDLFVFEIESVGPTTSVVVSRFFDRTFEIESSLLRPFVRGEDLKPCHVLATRRCILFPYYLDGDRTVYYSEAQLKSRFPNAWRYLMAAREDLEARGSERMHYPVWYALWNARDIRLLTSPKILVPTIAARPSFAFDRDGSLFFLGSGAGGPGAYGITLRDDIKESPYYVLGILNSDVTHTFIQATSSPFRGGFRAYSQQFIAPIPIPRIDMKSPQRLIHDRIAGLVSAHCETSDEATDRSPIAHEVNSLVAELFGIPVPAMS